MGAFEHIISLLSFVFALAITHLLLTVAGLIRNWGRVRLSWRHGLWLLNSLITTVANWISFWDLRTIGVWSVGTIFFTFLLSFVTYLQVALVCPDIPAEGTIDLAVFHDEQSRRYIGAFAATCLVAFIANFVFANGFHVAEWNAQNLAVLPMTVAAIVAMSVRARWAQIAMPLVMMAVWVFYFVDLQQALR
jgi:hypothetical protein